MRPIDDLPDPGGPLSCKLPSATIVEVNHLVQEVMQGEKQNHDLYKTYSPTTHSVSVWWPYHSFQRPLCICHECFCGSFKQTSVSATAALQTSMQTWYPCTYSFLLYSVAAAVLWLSQIFMVTNLVGSFNHVNLAQQKFYTQNIFTTKCLRIR